VDRALRDVALVDRVIVIARRSLIAFVLLVIALYIGDDFVLRWRMGRGAPGGALDTVTVYYATRLKNGKTEVFYGSPGTEVCSRSLFPHMGYHPCWYVRRANVKIVD
jgi:hypothetical protein